MRWICAALVIAASGAVGACTIERSALGHTASRDAGPGRDSGGLDGADVVRDAGFDACVTCECDTDLDCPAERRDDWGACSDFSAACDTRGTQSRDVHVWLCQGRRCVENVIVETQGCTRPVEGTACGATSEGAWSSCTFADDCVLRGSQSREVTGMFCRSGDCVAQTVTEDRECTRSTGGDLCTQPDGCSGVCAFGECATACVDCSRACPSGCTGRCEGTGLDRCCMCTC